MNIVDPSIFAPLPTAIHEYSEGADIRNQRSLFAGLTVIVKVKLPSAEFLFCEYTYVAAVLLPAAKA
jgi:hypothetical protein